MLGTNVVENIKNMLSKINQCWNVPLIWLTFGPGPRRSLELTLPTGEAIISIISMNSLHPTYNFYSRSPAAETCLSFYTRGKELLWVACRNWPSLHGLHRLLDDYSCSQVFFFTRWAVSHLISCHLATAAKFLSLCCRVFPVGGERYLCKPLKNGWWNGCMNYTCIF